MLSRSRVLAAEVASFPGQMSIFPLGVYVKTVRFFFWCNSSPIETSRHKRALLFTGVCIK